MKKNAGRFEEGIVLYQIGSDAAEDSRRSRGRPKGKGRGRGVARSPSRVVASSYSSEEEEVPATHVEEEEEEAGGSASPSSSGVWLGGTLTLPRRPIPLDIFPLIGPTRAR